MISTDGGSARGACARGDAGLAALVSCLGRLPAALLVMAAASGLPAVAAEFRSVGTAAAILYDGPSLQARRLWVAPRQMPLEVLATVGQWIKVRDVSGDAAWIERAELSAQRSVVVRVNASVRAAGQEGADVLFIAERGIALELLDPAPVFGWIRVRHRDGSAGWVRSAEVWGL